MANAAQFNTNTMNTGTAEMSLAEYKSGGRGRAISLVLACLFCVGGGIAALFGLTRTTLSESDRFPLGIIGAAFVLVGWAMIENWLRTRNRSVSLTRDGLIYNKNGTLTTVRWDEIAGVWQNITRRYYNGVYTGTTHVYTLQTYDKKKLTFNDTLKNVEELGNTIQKEVSNRHLPRAMETYNSGGTVSFGTVSVNRLGLTKGDKTLPWNEIQGVQIKKGYIQIKKQGKWLNWANIPVSAIPNMLVFLTLVDRIVGISTPK